MHINAGPQDEGELTKIWFFDPIANVDMDGKIYLCGDSQANQYFSNKVS